MARYRRRRRRRWTRPGLLFPGTVVAVVAIWWLYPRDDEGPTGADRTALPKLTSDRPDITPESAPRPGVSEKGA